VTVTEVAPVSVGVEEGQSLDLSLVIPTFNEADNITELLRQLTDAIPQGLAAEVIFVDDSRDNTPEPICSTRRRSSPTWSPPANTLTPSSSWPAGTSRAVTAADCQTGTGSRFRECPHWSLSLRSPGACVASAIQ
jgi:hypothetical protein